MGCVVRQRGVVLIVVLWVLALLTVLLAAFTAAVKVERQTVSDVVRSIEARAAADAVFNYLAALNAISAPELPEMMGQRYELVLSERKVSFRVFPEKAFIPVNQLDVLQLELLFGVMGVEDAAGRAAYVVELREGVRDEASGVRAPAVKLASVDHLAQVLHMDVEPLREYARWLSFVGEHQQLSGDFGAGAVFESIGLSMDEVDGQQWVPGDVYRVQVEVEGAQRPRQLEGYLSFQGAKYKLLQVNEYDAGFSLDSSND